MDTNEQRTATQITTLTTDLNDLDKRLNNETKQTANLQGKVDTFYFSTHGGNHASLMPATGSSRPVVTVFN